MDTCTKWTCLAGYPAPKRSSCLATPLRRPVVSGISWLVLLLGGLQAPAHVSLRILTRVQSPPLAHHQGWGLGPGMCVLVSPRQTRSLWAQQQRGECPSVCGPTRLTGRHVLCALERPFMFSGKLNICGKRDSLMQSFMLAVDFCLYHLFLSLFPHLETGTLFPACGCCCNR